MNAIIAKGRTVVAVCVMMGALCFPAAGQTQKELLAAAKAIQKQLAAQEEASTELRTELAKIEIQVQKLLQTDPTTLQSKLATATALIEENQDTAEIAPQVEALREAVFGYQIRKRDAFIAMLAVALKKADERKGDSPYTASTRTHVVALQDLVSAAAGHSSTEALNARVTALTTLLSENAALQSGDLTLPALEGLLTQLITLEDSTFLAALRRRVAALDGMLSKPMEVKFALRLADFGALTSLRDKINAVLPNETAKVQGIFVVSARYGRLSGPKSGGHSCNVRPTLVKSCHGQPSCQISAETFGTFCGSSDPAPFALSKHKGLAVRYVCLNQTAANWNALIRANASSYAGHAQTAILHSDADEIACALQ